MQMAMRTTLLLVSVSHAAGLSILAIPSDKRVTTVSNINTGLGVVRPIVAVATEKSTAAVSASFTKSDSKKEGKTAVAGGNAKKAAVFAPKPKPLKGAWKVEALFEMKTTAPVFTEEYAANAAGFALTLADRLMWATGVPLTRFAFYLPDPVASVKATSVVFCETQSNEKNAGVVIARYASARNSTYQCRTMEHKMNATIATIGKPALLQQNAVASLKPLTFEVGIYPPSLMDGDMKPSVQVAQMVVENAVSGDEPQRKLLPTGLWSYQAGPGVKFHGLFPATSAALPGQPFAQPRGTSIALGPNPGGQGAEPPAKPLPLGPGEDAKSRAAQTASLNDVGSVLQQANEINLGVKNSLEELKQSLARGSAAHAAWMTTNVYKLPADLIG